MTDHAVYEEQICAMLDGELSAEEEASLRAHLDECETCRAFLAAMEAVYGLSAKDLPEAPADLAETVMERVRAQAEPQPKKGKVVRFPYKPLAAAAAAALVLWAGSGLLGALRPKGAMSAAAPAAASGAVQTYSVATADEAAEEEAPEASESAIYGTNGAAGSANAPIFDAAAPMEEFARDAGEAPTLMIRGTQILLDGESVAPEELPEALEAVGKKGVHLEYEDADAETAEAVEALLAQREIPVL